MTLPFSAAGAEDGLTAEGIATLLQQRMEQLAQNPDKPESRKRQTLLTSLQAHLTKLQEGELTADSPLGKQGTTALMLAASLGEEEVARFLLQQGADAHLQNAKGKSALSFARSDSMRALLQAPRPEVESELPPPEEQPMAEEEQALEEEAPEPEQPPAPEEPPLANEAPAPAEADLPPPSALPDAPFRDWEDATHQLLASYPRISWGNNPLFAQWQQLRAAAEVGEPLPAAKRFALAGEFFGMPRAARFIRFLLQDTESQQPMDITAWYCHIYSACMEGLHSESEHAAQWELLSPYAHCLSPAAETAQPCLWLAAAAGDTQLVEALLQKGVPAYHHGAEGTPLSADALRLASSIPAPCYAKLQGLCRQPAAAAALCGHSEALRLLLPHHTRAEELNDLLALACLTPLRADFDAIERLLLGAGAQHSALSLACAAARRDDAYVRQLLAERTKQPKRPKAQRREELTSALLCLVAHGTGHGKGHRCELAEELVRAGANIHALERPAQGDHHHALYRLMSSSTNESVQLYATLVSLGMNEKRVLSLQMTPSGKRLLDACNRAQASFVTCNVSPYIIIDASEQKLIVRGGMDDFSAPVSTGSAGLGYRPDSGCTPLGRFSVHSLHGKDAPQETIFRSLRPVGRFPNDVRPDEDAILSRVLTLDGKDPENRNTRSRNIYIHGTSSVDKLGQPASHGCIRLSPEDMVELFELAYPGMEVIILP